MKLAHVLTGTVVKLPTGDLVVVAYGPSTENRYVVGESGMPVIVNAMTDVEVKCFPWSREMAPAILQAAQSVIGAEKVKETIFG